jgi:Xaa-Pro dipeptidase
MDAQPLSFDYAGRLERARDALAREGAAGMVLTPGANLRYFTGLAVGGSERLLALLLRAAGKPVVVAPAFERGRVETGARIQVELATWRDGEDPFALAHRALAGGSWLLDPNAPFWIAERFRGQGSPMLPATGVCTGLRRRKEPAEVEALARAQRLSHDTLESLRARLEPAASEREVSDWILGSFRQAGAEGWAIVQFGQSSALPHGEPGGRRLGEATAVLVDLGAVVEGYHGDLTRAWWHGDGRPARHAQVADAVVRAQAAAVGLARHGTAAQELDRAARRVLDDAGLASWFVHRLGHGVGLDIHEEPFLVEGNARELEVGEVVTVEPGVYLPDEFGLRHEDVVVIDGDGCRKL